MRIGIVCQNYPPARFEGGISHYSALLAAHLASLGHEVFAITSTEFTLAQRALNASRGIKIRLVKGPWGFDAVGVIRQMAISIAMDAVILQFSPASFNKPFRAAWALTPFPCQKITAFHTLWGKGLDRLMGLLMLFGTPKIIATNSEIITILERRLPLLLKRTYWIPIGSNILPSHQERQREEFSTPSISYFGMLYPGKGLDTILDALEALMKQGYRFAFRFIGGGMLDLESYEKAFGRDIENRGLKGAVECLGLIPAEDVSRHLAQSRFLFLPYESGLSDRRGSFMAAIAHKKAVLTSPPIVEMPFLRNGHNVLWPQKASVPAYVECMERLLQDDDLVAHLERGAGELSRHFRWEKIAHDYDLVMGQRRCVI
ncbi:MAG: glycosyltransferase family 4 protein [Thermodesulfobacteriota bacterium]|nr:glycosyltransferase family 4 protein [Thermodesulfobacteriota bacterium]